MLKKTFVIPVILMLVISGCAAAQQNQSNVQTSKTTTQPSAQSDQIALGQQKFNQVCADCHGRNGDNVHLVDDVTVNGYVKTLAGTQAVLANFIQADAPMADDGSSMNMAGMKSSSGGSSMNMSSKSANQDSGSQPLSKADSHAIAAYIWSGKGEVKPLNNISIDGAPTTDKLFQAQGCADCHGTQGDCIRLVEHPDNKLLFDLVGSPQRLASFIKMYAPMTDAGNKDPKSGALSDAQATSLSAYLWNLGN